MRSLLRRGFEFVFVALLVLSLTSCSSVPQEVVDLSTVIGEDLAVIHDTYLNLVHEHFNDLRAQRQDYLDNVWTPAFIKTWITKGHLVSIANGQETYSVERHAFVKPTPGRETDDLLSSVRMWAHGATTQIAKKKSELMAPLDDDERSLTESIDQAFGKLFRGNAAITAHLNSLRKVQGAQDDILKSLNLKDMREKISKGLADASDRAQNAFSKVQAADQKLLNIQDQFKTEQSKLKDMIDSTGQ